MNVKQHLIGPYFRKYKFLNFCDFHGLWFFSRDPQLSYVLVKLTSIYESLKGLATGVSDGLGLLYIYSTVQHIPTQRDSFFKSGWNPFFQGTVLLEYQLLFALCILIDKVRIIHTIMISLNQQIINQLNNTKIMPFKNIELCLLYFVFADTNSNVSNNSMKLR